MPKVLIICTGGTIGMEAPKDKFQDAPSTFAAEVKKLLPSTLKNFPETELLIYSPQMDSSEMTIEDWNKIGKDIKDNYHKYDGFVILHGTDTMAYTGSALSFMLENIHKPVILTGAQTPLSEVVNDARENLINAVFIAGNKKINEVCIYFNQFLFRANRAIKYSTIDYSAYVSPNYPALAKVGSKIEIDKSRLLSRSSSENVIFTPFRNFDIRYIQLTPNMSAAVFAKMMEGAQAVIIGTYGDGNMRVKDGTFLDAIRAELAKGTIIVSKSQCLHSKTLPQYDAGSMLEKMGVISAIDQTLETVVCKLTYLFSQDLTKEKVHSLMRMNLRGELSPQSTEVNRYTFADVRRYTLLNGGHNGNGASAEHPPVNSSQSDRAAVAGVVNS